MINWTRTIEERDGVRTDISRDPLSQNVHDSASELYHALKNAVARMEENIPPKAKRGDLDGTFRRATYYRDLHAARAVIEKVESE